MSPRKEWAPCYGCCLRRFFLPPLPQACSWCRQETDVGPVSVLGGYVGPPYTTIQHWASVGKRARFITVAKVLHLAAQQASLPWGKKTDPRVLLTVPQHWATICDLKLAESLSAQVAQCCPNTMADVDPMSVSTWIGIWMAVKLLWDDQKMIIHVCLSKQVRLRNHVSCKHLKWKSTTKSSGTRSHNTKLMVNILRNAMPCCQHEQSSDWVYGALGMWLPSDNPWKVQTLTTSLDWDEFINAQSRSWRNGTRDANQSTYLLSWRHCGIL